MNDFFPALVLAGKKNTHRSLEQTILKCGIKSICQRHSPCNMFLTIAPNNVNSLDTFRITFRSNSNKDFFATMSDKLYDDCITNCPILSEGEIRTPATSAIKAKRVVNNLFAATNGFRRDLMPLLTAMLQLQPSNLGVYSRNLKTTHHKERKKNCMVTHLLAAA